MQRLSRGSVSYLCVPLLGSDNLNGYFGRIISKITSWVSLNIKASDGMHDDDQGNSQGIFCRIISSLQVVVDFVFSSLIFHGQFFTYPTLSGNIRGGEHSSRQVQRDYYSDYFGYNALTPFFIRYFEPHIVVTPYVERFPPSESPASFLLGWKLRNNGRRTAKNVKVSLRFILRLRTINPTEEVDKEFIVFDRENLLPPSGHQPDFQILMFHKLGENKFHVSIEVKEVTQNVIQRSRRLEELPIIKEFPRQYGLWFVVIALDGDNLRDKDKELKKYDLVFTAQAPIIRPMTTESADFYRHLGI